MKDKSKLNLLIRSMESDPIDSSGTGNDYLWGNGGNDMVLFWREKQEAANDESTNAWRVAA